MRAKTCLGLAAVCVAAHLIFKLAQRGFSRKVNLTTNLRQSGTVKPPTCEHHGHLSSESFDSEICGNRLWLVEAHIQEGGSTGSKMTMERGQQRAVLRGSSRKRAAGILFCTVRVYRQVTNVINVGQL